MFSRRTPRALAVSSAGIMIAALAIACEGESDDSVLFPGLSAELNEQLASLRDATEGFQDFQNAAPAGYEVLVAHPTNGNLCLRNAQLGGMGLHYLNPAILDGAVSVAEPEVLIYEPQADGSRELVGVEYVVPFTIRGDDESPPALLGQQFRRNYTFGLWALHAWAWKNNPTGVFADWNPDVTCENVGAVQ